jgi:hypothetical protein
MPPSQPILEGARPWYRLFFSTNSPSSFACGSVSWRPWLGAAAEPRRAFSTYVLCDVHVRQLPLDEGYAVLRGVRDGESRAENARKRLERARHWVWTVIDPESKRRWVTEVGPRPLEMVQRVVHHVVAL